MSPVRRVVARWSAVALVVAFAPACASGSHATEASGPSTTVHTNDRYGTRSSAATSEGASWRFVEGLTIRLTGAARVSSQLGGVTRRDARMELVRIDFTYTNDGPAVNLSEGRQMPVRLLYGSGQVEATQEGGYIGTSDQLTLRVPVRVEPHATVSGASSFIVPETGMARLAVLVVEPRRYTEHLFTDVERLLGPPR